MGLAAKISQNNPVNQAPEPRPQSPFAPPAGFAASPSAVDRHAPFAETMAPQPVPAYAPVPPQPGSSRSQGGGLPPIKTAVSAQAAPHSALAYHKLIANATSAIERNCIDRGKVRGRLAGVVGGLGAMGMVGVVSAAAAGVLTATLTFPPIVALLIAVPLLAGVVMGVLIRAQTRKNILQTKHYADAIETLRSLRAELRSRPISVAEGQLLKHLERSLQRLQFLGAPIKDAAEIGVIGVLTGAVVGVFAAAVYGLSRMFAPSRSNGGSKAGLLDGEAEPFYGWNKRGALFDTTRSRAAKENQRNIVATEPVSLGRSYEELSKTLKMENFRG